MFITNADNSGIAENNKQRCSARRKISGVGIFSCNLIFFLLTSLIFCLPAMADRSQTGGGQIVLTNLLLDNKPGNLAVRFSLRLDDPDALAALLKELRPTVLHVQASLFRKKAWWPDEKLATTDLRLKLRYAPEEKAYIITGPQGDGRNADLKALIAAYWQNLSLDVYPLALLEHDVNYVVELKVALLLDDIPTWRKTLLFFSSFEALPSVRYELEFRY